MPLITPQCLHLEFPQTHSRDKSSNTRSEVSDRKPSSGRRFAEAPRTSSNNKPIRRSGSFLISRHPPTPAPPSLINRWFLWAVALLLPASVYTYFFLLSLLSPPLPSFLSVFSLPFTSLLQFVVSFFLSWTLNIPLLHFVFSLLSLASAYLRRSFPILHVFLTFTLVFMLSSAALHFSSFPVFLFFPIPRPFSSFFFFHCHFTQSLFLSP